jgi:hypothetical protein
MSHCNALSRLTLGVAATTATTATSASGAIVVFDIPDTTLDTSQNNSTLYFTAINLQAATLTIGIDGPPGFSIDVGTYFQFSGYFTASTNEFFSAGNTIDSNLSFFGNTFPYSSEVPNGIVYLGLVLAQNEAFSEFNYGWFEINSTDNPLNGAHVFTFTRFAFNDVAGQSILAGQTTAIPEASTLGLVGGLFSLAAAAHIRRRRQQKAAASDKFLALAAGEKLN